MHTRYCGNSPLKLLTKDAERLSIVCYLRQGVYENSKGTKPEDIEKNLKKYRGILKKYNKVLEAEKNKLD